MMAVAAKLPAQSLPVSHRHDADEREARRVAEVVERGSSVADWSFSSVPVSARSAQASDHTRTCGCGGTCPECRAAKLRPSARADTPAAGVDSGVVAPALRTGGRPLEPAARSFFEARLGADFSDVRIHADSTAAHSADSLNAHAYAVGRHVVFGAGEYRPDSAQGRRLLAHELAHVVQQGSGEARIQRDEKEAKATPVDVAIILDNDIKSLRAAQALAPKAVRVYNASDAADKLKKVGAPIGTLYVVSHASSEGELQFESKDGITFRVKLADLAKDLKSVLPADKTPQVIDFRGCKLGEATEELGKFREAVGTKTVKAVNCWTFDDVQGPVSIDGLPITSEGDLTDDNRTRFEKGLGMLVNTLKSEDGRSVKDCTLGLGPGDTAAKNMAKIRKQYFAAGGTITAEWVSPEYNQKWQAGSKCFKDLTTSTEPCKLTEKTAPPPEPAQGSGKKAAVEGPETATEGVEATASGPAPEAEEATA
jgi:Domain of unknown function (DUF4157)